MTKPMNVRDAQLRLEQIREGRLPAKDVPALSNPLYARAYDGFLRHGSTCNTLREGTDGAGGFLVPDEFEGKIVRAMKGKNVLRQLSTIMTTRRNWKIPLAVGDGHAYWVPEEGPIPEVSTAFDQLERVVDTEDVGRIQMEDLVELQHAIPEPYRENAVFLMSDAAKRELSKIRTAFDRNIWQRDLCEDVPVKLLGKPVIICDALPEPASGSMPVLYGDFSRYVIGDREHRSVKRLSELYARQGQVAYIISQRVDATLLDKRAIAGLKVR